MNGFEKSIRDKNSKVSEGKHIRFNTIYVDEEINPFTSFEEETL